MYYVDCEEAVDWRKWMSKIPRSRYARRGMTTLGLSLVARRRGFRIPHRVRDDERGDFIVYRFIAHRPSFRVSSHGLTVGSWAVALKFRLARSECVLNEIQTKKPPPSCEDGGYWIFCSLLQAADQFFHSVGGSVFSFDVGDAGNLGADLNDAVVEVAAPIGESDFWCRRCLLWIPNRRSLRRRR